MLARFPGTCTNCNNRFSSGAEIRFVPGSGVVGCPACGVAKTETTELRGRVDRVKFQKDTWTIAILLVSEGDHAGEDVNVVGDLGRADVGDDLTVSGYWDKHPKFGIQFKAIAAEIQRPADTAGAVRYLGRLPNVGPTRAAAIVDRLGVDGAFKALDDRAVTTLAEIPGITLERAAQIVAVAASDRDHREALVFLQGPCKLWPRQADRVIKELGAERVIERLRRDPYILIDHVYGFGWERADQVATALDIPADAPVRLRAAWRHACRLAEDQGHTACTVVRALHGEGRRAPGVISLTSQREDDLRAALDSGIASGLLVRVGPDGGDPQGDDFDLLQRIELRAAEVTIVSKIAKLLGESSGAPLDGTSIVPDAVPAEMDLDGMALDEGQRAAVMLARDANVMILTGGPGTGKSTVLEAILRDWDAEGLRMVLCAPTGKAAKRMTETTGRDASTIHRLIYSQDDPLSGADAVVIDETSMCDCELLAAVCSRVSRHARLLLVGDADQLPSIGAGQVLRDLIDSGGVPIARLTTIHRQAAGGTSWICENAKRILEGRLPHHDNAALADYFWIECPGGEDGAEQAAHAIVASVARAAERFGVDPIRDVAVLVPKKKEGAPLRAGRFNEALQAKYNPPEAGKEEVVVRKRAKSELDGVSAAEEVVRVGDRVRHTVNNYEIETSTGRGVFNGEVGHVAAIRKTGKRDVAIDVDLGDRIATYDRLTMSELTLNYASTVHSVQGSEYPVVVMAVHEVDAWMLRRPLVYTALTRAKRAAIVVGSARGMQEAVRKGEDYRRVTLLKERVERMERGEAEQAAAEAAS